jgi:hypothetical protein
MRVMRISAKVCTPSLTILPSRCSPNLRRHACSFAVLALPDTPPGEKGTVHVTMLFNFFDELKRRIPAK